MKTNKRVYVICSTLFFGLLLFSFQFFISNEEFSISELNRRQISRWENLLKATENLRYWIIKEKDTHKKCPETLSEYRKLRDAFKAYEYLGENSDPLFFKLYLNGSPLPKLEENSFEPKIIEPKGLQKIDELISNNRLDNSEQIYKLLNELTSYLSTSKPAKLYTRDFYNASRIELVRLFSLSLSGFDTPGTSDYKKDALTSINTMKSDLMLFHLEIPLDNFNKCLRLFDEFKWYLQNTKQEKLDYAKIIKAYVDPLFLELFIIQNIQGIEFPDEYEKFPPAINLRVKSIFDAKLVNPNYYSRVPLEYKNQSVEDLGRLLFFDPILSGDGKRACASCHQADKGFSDQLAKSYAFNREGYLDRNAPGLVNAIFSTRFFHDMRASSFEDQMEHVVHNEKEFNTDYFTILKNLKQSEGYKSLFKQCFPKELEAMTFKNVQFAIAAYIQSLVGLNSEFDKFIRNEKKQLSQEAIAGFNLFMGKGKCAICHFAPIFNGTVPPLFLDSESEVFGVFENPKTKKIDADRGRGNALLKEKVNFYQYSFKTPTVRNAQLTFPYMHHGEYATLEQVMEFYNKGGAVGQKLTLDHQTLPSNPLKLSKKEINQLISFINALTDTSGLTKKPAFLPFTSDLKYKNRVVGGQY